MTLKYPKIYSKKFYEWLESRYPETPEVRYIEWSFLDFRSTKYRPIYRSIYN
jgi:hypothetical protein